MSGAPAEPAAADASPDPATVPVARSPWMPPRFFLVLGLAGLALHYALGGPVLLRLPWLGVALAVAGFSVMAWGARTFAAAKTTIKPFEKSSVVVTAGPYGFTRNPMYLGMVAMLTGLALALGTLGPWAAVVALAVLLQVRFIRNEERALTASLGEQYERYRRSVRRWL
ncbi:MAG: isoprenylcysteine carboxylmethyltransferase family protein [Myxococcota bacterium]